MLSVDAKCPACGARCYLTYDPGLGEYTTRDGPGPEGARHTCRPAKPAECPDCGAPAFVPVAHHGPGGAPTLYRCESCGHMRLGPTAESPAVPPMACEPAATAGARCPDCGRPVHAVPAGGGVQRLTLLPLVGGYSFGPHVCLPRGARYPMVAVREGPARG